VFRRYQKLPGVSGVFGERNPLWQLSSRADGAKALLELWWATDDEGRVLRHDFTDPSLDTRFLGDLYQDLSEHARKQYALLQTPEFVEEFILDRTLDPAIETFGLDEVRMIDPTCGSGHFLLGAFDRLSTAGRSASLARRSVSWRSGRWMRSTASTSTRSPSRSPVPAAGRCTEGLEIPRLADAPDFQINVATATACCTERISSKDSALTTVYRDLYSTAVREFQLTAPMTQRFFDLALPGTDVAGFVGLIIGNAFMTRQFGKPLVEQFLPTRNLSAVIDTSAPIYPDTALRR
jgi:hypothetical protein